MTGLDFPVDPDVGSVIRDDTISTPMIANQRSGPARQGGADRGFEAGLSNGFGSDYDAVLIDTGAILVLLRQRPTARRPQRRLLLREDNGQEAARP